MKLSKNKLYVFVEQGCYTRLIYRQGDKQRDIVALGTGEKVQAQLLKVTKIDRQCDRVSSVSEGENV